MLLSLLMSSVTIHSCLLQLLCLYYYFSYPPSLLSIHLYCCPCLWLYHSIVIPPLQVVSWYSVCYYLRHAFRVLDKSQDHCTITGHLFLMLILLFTPCFKTVFQKSDTILVPVNVDVTVSGSLPHCTGSIAAVHTWTALISSCRDKTQHYCLFW